MINGKTKSRTNTHYMWQYYTEKEPKTKGHMLSIFIYIKHPKYGRSTEAEKTSICRNWGMGNLECHGLHMFVHHQIHIVKLKYPSETKWKLKSLSGVQLFVTPRSVQGILQAIEEWVAIPFSRGSSQPRDWTQVSCIAGRFFYLVVAPLEGN